MKSHSARCSCAGAWQRRSWHVLHSVCSNGAPQSGGSFAQQPPIKEGNPDMTLCRPNSQIIFCFGAYILECMTECMFCRAKVAQGVLCFGAYSSAYLSACPQGISCSVCALLQRQRTPSLPSSPASSSRRSLKPTSMPSCVAAPFLRGISEFWTPSSRTPPPFWDESGLSLSILSISRYWTLCTLVH